MSTVGTIVNDSTLQHKLTQVSYTFGILLGREMGGGGGGGGGGGWGLEALPLILKEKQLRPSFFHCIAIAFCTSSQTYRQEASEALSEHHIFLAGVAMPGPPDPLDGYWCS